MGRFCSACGMNLPGESGYCPDCGAIIGVERDMSQEPVLYMAIEPTVVDQNIQRVRPNILAGLSNESRGVLLFMITLLMFLLWESFPLGLATSPILSAIAITIVSSIENNRLRKRLMEEDKILPEKGDIRQYLIRGRKK